VRCGQSVWSEIDEELPLTEQVIPGLLCGTSCVNLTPLKSLSLPGSCVLLLLRAERVVDQLAVHELGDEADHVLEGDQVYQQHGDNLLLCCSAEDNVVEAAAAAFHS